MEIDTAAAAAANLHSVTGSSLESVPDEILLEVSIVMSCCGSLKPGRVVWWLVRECRRTKADASCLHQIWTILDDPTSLYLASKRFVSYSKDPFVRSRWLLHRYMPCKVIFEAIARPKQLRKVISEGRYVSLPLSFQKLPRGCREDPVGSMLVMKAEGNGAERALILMPSLAPLFHSNGESNCHPSRWREQPR